MGCIGTNEMRSSGILGAGKSYAQPQQPILLQQHSYQMSNILAVAKRAQLKRFRGIPKQL